jgi:hypothetical protein
MKINKEKLQIEFKNSETINKNYSQSAQDIFVLMCLDGKKNGTFLDLGCHHPININNTYLLETHYNWDGVSIDIDKSMTDLFGIRKTTSLTEDCTKLDFNKILNLYDSKHIDYLSLDLEPASITLNCLKTIPFNDIEFSVITFEHDVYRFGDDCRNKSRELLEGYGYKRICSDVSNGYNIYEDWYYNPKYVSHDRIKIIESEGKEWSDILFKN